MLECPNEVVYKEVVQDLSGCEEEEVVIIPIETVPLESPGDDLIGRLEGGDSASVVATQFLYEFQELQVATDKVRNWMEVRKLIV